MAQVVITAFDNSVWQPGKIPFERLFTRWDGHLFEDSVVSFLKDPHACWSSMAAAVPPGELSENLLQNLSEQVTAPPGTKLQKQFSKHLRIQLTFALSLPQSAYDPSLTCQCNDECGDYGNCCDDYNDVCDGGSGSDSSCAGRCGEGEDERHVRSWGC